MNKKIKNKVLEACITSINEKIKTLEFAVEDAQKAANEYGNPRDRYDSFRAQQLRKKDMFSKHLQEAIDEKNTLNKIDTNKENSQVVFGALVITNKQNLFISTSIGKINIDENDYYAISSFVPIFKILRGLKVGDTAEFKGNKFKIIDII